MSKLDLKIVLLGQSSVGKSALCDRFLHSRFSGTISNTIGAAFGAKQLDVDGRQVYLGLWDTAGAERFESLSRLYYRGAGAAVVCFDVTNEPSFRKVQFWVNEIKLNEDACLVFVVACKMDLVASNPSVRTVTRAEAAEYSKSIGAEYYETSARTGENVDALFVQVARDHVRRVAEIAAAAPKSARRSGSMNFRDEYSVNVASPVGDPSTARSCYC